MKKICILFLFLSMMLIVSPDAEAKGPKHHIHRPPHKEAVCHRCDCDSLLTRLFGLNSGCCCKHKQHPHHKPLPCHSHH